MWSFVFQMELSSPAFPNPSPLHLTTQAGRKKEQGKGIYIKEYHGLCLRKEKYSGNALWWVGQQKGWVVTTTASCLLCDFGGNHVISPPQFSSLWKYLDGSICKLKNKSTIYKIGLLKPK